jgi:hypothetical protein
MQDIFRRQIQAFHTAIIDGCARAAKPHQTDAMALRLRNNALALGRLQLMMANWSGPASVGTAPRAAGKPDYYMDDGAPAEWETAPRAGGKQDDTHGRHAGDGLKLSDPEPRHREFWQAPETVHEANAAQDPETPWEIETKHGPKTPPDSQAAQDPKITPARQTVAAFETFPETETSSETEPAPEAGNASETKTIPEPETVLENGRILSGDTLSRFVSRRLDPNESAYQVWCQLQDAEPATPRRNPALPKAGFRSPLG